MSYLEGLNEKQKEAVLHKKGPLLVLAGAGAGKTKTLTHRIFHLIKSGVLPEKILAITFTNKAAKEMRERITHLLGGDSSFPTFNSNFPHVSTFHSLGVLIIREQHKFFNLPKHFTIYDRDDSKRAIREAMKETGIDPKSFEPGKILSIIGREKGDLVTAKDYEKKSGRNFIAATVCKVWKEYEKIIEREKSLDFDDLLLKTALLFKTETSVREHYRNKWDYIHIDEYQDTNEAQYFLTKVLSARHKNIAVVGDVDQNIYSFRGASIKNILDFEKDYPEAKVVVLEENYRSTQTILTVANRIIAKNKRRKEKNLFTRLGDGEKISLYEAYDGADEANFAASKAKELIGDRKIASSDIAVLYRANFQSRALEEAFMNANVPYQVLGVRFFERKEIKDIVAYLRAALSPENLTDVKRIINTPARGLGKTSVLKIFSGQRGALPSATKEKVDTFYGLLEKIKEKAEKGKLSETVSFILKESGLLVNLKKNREEDLERLENMKELSVFATRYDNLPSEEAIERFLTDTALQSDQDELAEKKEGVKLMTVHAAKGLEFDTVFITGLEEGLFPHSGFGENKNNEERMEEERRLFYVALTRAKRKLYLSYTMVRTIFGSSGVSVPSEFIFDIDEEFIEREERFEGGGKTVYLD
ncbi:MAG: 3'-5' exonuclease [bacterium]|nr:3'-5' exonuclease [bacterium]